MQVSTSSDGRNTIQPVPRVLLVDASAATRDAFMRVCAELGVPCIERTCEAVSGELSEGHARALRSKALRTGGRLRKAELEWRPVP